MPKKRSQARQNQAHSSPSPLSVSLPTSASLTPAEARERGLREFRAKRYPQAIAAWQQVLQLDEPLTRARAEAHFRLGVSGSTDSLAQSEAALTQLRHASDLVPADPIYAYHLGLALHRQGRTSEARDHYQRAVANGLARKGSGVVMALAELELDPHADVAAVPGVSDADVQTLAPILAFLRGQTQPQTTQPRAAELLQPLTTALRGPTPQDVLGGLIALAAGDAAQARTALTSLESKRLPRDIAVVQWHYIGVASARLNDRAGALEAWRYAKQLGQGSTTRYVSRYQDVLGGALAQQALTLLETDDRAAGLEIALDGAQFAPANRHLIDIVLTESDRIAQVAARSGDWATARQHWARALITSTTNTGSRAAPSFAHPPLVIRGLAHNLALASEATGDWLEAANAWRTMLRTKPRKNSRDARTDSLSDPHWAWLRKHVIGCYKQAGDLAQAIAVCRQVLKAQPDDADLQLDLVEALLANDQMTVGMNELQKLVKKHPQHTEALSRLAQLHTAREQWSAAEQALLQALQAEPDSPKVRGHMADLLIDWGASFNESNRYDRARDVFERALTFAPANYNVHLWLARVDFNQNKPVLAREHLERAMALGKNKNDVYVKAFECWIVEKNLAEARSVLARAEANGQLTVPVFVGAGESCLRHAAPANAPSPLDFLFGPPRKPQKPAAPDEYTLLARELFDRAIALGPEAEAIHAIIDACGPSQFGAVLPYIHRLTQLLPEDARTWMLLGIALGTDQQIPEAQKALREAARLARKQGQNELAQQADELRKMIADPMFALAMQAAPLMNELGGMPGGLDVFGVFDDDDDDDDDGPGDFFNLLNPPRPKRRKR